MIVRGGMFTPLISWYPVLLRFVARRYGRSLPTVVRQRGVPHRIHRLLIALGNLHCVGQNEIAAQRPSPRGMNVLDRIIEDVLRLQVRAAPSVRRASRSTRYAPSAICSESTSAWIRRPQSAIHSGCRRTRCSLDKRQEDTYSEPLRSARNRWCRAVANRSR